MEKFTITAFESDKQLRLDKFLVAKLAELKPEISRSRIKSFIESGLVFDQKRNLVINDCAYKIKGSEDFIVTIPQAQTSQILAKNIFFEIAFEDEHMLVINKPAGLTTHPGNGNQQDTLVNALLFHCKNSLSGINGILRPGIVHRLDKDTSGLMVVAKNDLAHQELAKQIANRTLKRNYLALCFGVPKPMSGVIDKNIGRSKINRLKMLVMKIGGRKAITHYQVKEIFHNGAFSLVECKLETGRTHQIRVHLSAIGHSVIGDAVYGNRRKSLSDVDDETKNLVNNFPRQALHSYKISFLHPFSKEEMEFEVGLPEDIEHLKNNL